ncbi:class I adenylate-forming enzyme family protein [Azospirillum sp.]|uniref:class I adenylate-forming enzyme family protein n=1 Tax=Azospirillum sp. TaxID=34012 RepID=UPI003D7080A6
MAASPLAEALDRVERTVPAHRPALLGPRTLRYGELFERARRLAAFLQASGLGPGDRVLAADADALALPELLVAGLRCGVGVVSVDPACDVAALAREHGACMVFADGPAVPDRPVVALRPPGWLDRLLRPPAAPTLAEVLDGYAPLAEWPEPPGAERTACVLFTAGTHGAPRALAVPHGAMAAGAEAVADALLIDGRARLLNPLPLHHAGGLAHGLLAALLAGGTLVRPPPLALPADWVRRHGASHLIAAPAQLARLTAADPNLFRTGAFRFVVSLGGALDETRWRALEARFGVRVVTLYGPAEALAAAFAAGPGNSHRFATVGRSLGCEHRIVDEQGRPCAVGAVGELQLKGGHVMAEQGGWLATGDLATVDADGFVTLVGRRDAALRRGRVRVHPERTAAALRSHPDVEEAVAYAADGRLAAAVTLRRALRSEVLLGHLRDRLPPLGLPDTLSVLDALPRDSLGAPSPHALRAARRGPAADRAAIRGEGMLDDRFVR